MASPALRCFIDPDDPLFASPGDLPQRARDYCAITGQYVPQTVGEVMRCIYESLALKYRFALEQLKTVAGKHFSRLHILGGGTKDGLLCHITAASIGRPVVAGPIEATALGNILIQLVALGKLSSIENDSTIPADVAEKILRFAKCAVAVGWIHGKAYVNLGGVSMGIAGSYCDAAVFQKYFGMRAEWVDMTEIVRRITLGICDPDEYEQALAWVQKNCKEGFDCNAGKTLPDVITKSKVVSTEKDWKFVTKMTMVMRDILYSNPKFHDLGWHEEALGRNALAGGFQGQRQWTD